MRTRDKERAARRILRVFDQATKDELAEGIGWYAEAFRLAEELDPRDVARAAAVIAVLSPRQSWNVNAAMARNAYDKRNNPLMSRTAFTLPTLGANVEKVRRLLFDGEHPDDVVSGPKVRAFWRAIVDPADPRAIVIDRHAIDVAFGRVMNDRERGAILGKKGAYDEVAQRYVWAADVITGQGYHLTPVQVQAVTWVTWRRLKKEGAV